MTGPQVGAVRRWRERADAAGYRERTEAEWVAHPTALDDLLRVLCGTSLETIENDRRREKKARAS